MSEEKNIPQENSKNQIPSPIKEDKNISKSEPQPQITNMETHAQHLHKAPSHGWKHYLFEFLMLFLAVFAGFLAENQREQMVEHQHEKKYIRSLIQDLEKDTVNLQTY